MDFLPHGTCLLWNPQLLTLHIVSDATIALSYLIISVGLAAFVWQRKDLPFPWIFRMFGSFILACGITHLFGVVTIWFPLFWLDGWIKAFTAVVSIGTAVALYVLTPKALALPSPSDLQRLVRMYEREQRVAQRYQQASLPANLPTVPGLRFSSFYEAGSSELNVGGDWFDAMRLIDGRVIISIGDVAGSGLNAAVIMTSMRQVIRGVAQLHPDPVLMLDAADRALRADYPETFVTAFVAVIDPIFLTMTYASAGHPSPLILQNNGTISDLDYRGLLLGLREHDDLPAAIHQLEIGQKLIFYTDGLVEFERNSQEGEQLLRASIHDVAQYPQTDFAKAIHQRMLNSKENLSLDDIAILAVEISQPHYNETEAREGIARYTFEASDAQAARTTRLELVSGLHSRGVDQASCDAAELVFSELIGNTVRYAPGQINVSIDWTAPLPVLHVSDHGPGFWHIPKLPSDLMSESGRGLFLVQNLTNDFSVSKKPSGGSHARAVLRRRMA